MNIEKKHSCNSQPIDMSNNITQTDSDSNKTLQNTTISVRRLSDKHYQQCVVDRGLNPIWVEANARSVDERTASELLGYTAKSGGVWLEGTNGFGQFRPDRPWKNNPDSRGAAPKYRTAMGKSYDAILPVNPHKDNYWEDTEALKAECYKVDGHPCLIVTEGLFKAVAGCTNGMPTIALVGVEMGLTSSKDDPQGKRYVVPTLERFVKQGFGIITAFDADAATNSNVVKAENKLANQLAKFKVPVYTTSGAWVVDEGKGMDDYIQMNGADKFKSVVLAKAKTVEAWERQLKDSGEHKSDKVTANTIAVLMVQDYRDKLAWNIPRKSWFLYGSKKAGIFSETNEVEIEKIVTAKVRTITADFGHDLIKSTMNLLKGDLGHRDWNYHPDLVCLQDCVLNIKTLKTLAHAPGYRMLSQIPFRWADRDTGCDTIKNWLLEACSGHQDWVEIIRAAIKAALTEQGHLCQRLLELVGAGSTGKGTVLRLVQHLIGRENYATSTLQQIEKDKFETARFYAKKAVFITDSERYTGSCSMLKALTGADDVPNNRKFIQTEEDFKFKGVIFLAANEAVQSNDYTNGLSRRRLSLPFNNYISADKRDLDLDDKFKKYLPGLLLWVLEMDDASVRKYFVNTEKSVPSLKGFTNEVLMETNPLANWLNEKLYLDPTSETQVGNASSPPHLCLYPNYVIWAKDNGQGILSTTRFSSNLINLLKTQVGVDASKVHRKKGTYITQISIRNEAQSHLPPLIPRGGDDLATNGDDLVMTSVMTKNQSQSDGDDCDDLNEKVPGKSCRPDEADGGIGANNLANKSSPSSPPVTEPVLASTKSSPDSSPSHHPSPREAVPVKPGDLIVITDHKNPYSNDPGTIFTCNEATDEYVIHITHLVTKVWVKHPTKVTLNRCQFRTLEEQKAWEKNLPF